MSSYDVKALFTLVTADPALNIIHNKQQWDTIIHSRTQLSIPNSISLLKVCLKSAFFTFQGKYYKEVKGAAMGSPLNPGIANLFTEDF